MNDTMMWEAQAAPGKLDELLDWIRRDAVPFLNEQPHCRRADVYLSSEDRAVIIARFDGAPVPLPDAPEEAVTRAPHQWPFREVVTGEAG